MSEQFSPETRIASDADKDATARIGDIIVMGLLALPWHVALNVLVYVCMNLVWNTNTSGTKLEMWDSFAATVRKNLEEHIKRGMQ